jgi:hypothetical protein
VSTGAGEFIELRSAKRVAVEAVEDISSTAEPLTVSLKTITLSLVVTLLVTSSNIHTLCILPIQCISLLYMDVRRHSDFYPGIEHCRNIFYGGEGLCLPCGKGFIYRETTLEFVATLRCYES